MTLSSPAQPRTGIIADTAMLRGPLEERRRLLDRVASSGIDHVFVADHVSFHTGFGMDGLIQAATLAAQEPTLRVYIGIYLLALRHPVPVARQIASLCQSAPGRLVLGVGVGGEDRHEIEICGVDPRTRGRRTNESLRALRGLLSGEATTHACEFFEFEDALIRPAPDPAVPFVIGGRSNAAVQRAAELGDGWLGVWCSDRRFASVLAEIESLASAAGRSQRVERHGLQVWVGFDQSRTLARERLAGEMQKMYQVPFERFERYSPYGSAKEVADFLAPYVEAGCREFNVMPVGPSTEANIDAVAEVRESLASL